MQRKEISLSSTPLDIMFIMSEGNPGAATVLSKIIETLTVDGIMTVLSLDDMNIRGTQIWIGYKDFCHENLNEFIGAIKNRSIQMVDVINKEGLKGNHEAMAVVSGASFDGRKTLPKKEKEVV